MSTPYELAAQVLDPELRVLTIEELGILRAVDQDPGGTVRVTITPTYSGCPAMDLIRADVRTALARGGYPDAEVVTVLRPAWSTDLISPSGRAKLTAAGIAPPPVLGSGSGDPLGRAPGRPVPVRLSVRCPRCASGDTEELSRFSSTACKALLRCRACGEPFERVKPL